MVGEVVPLLSYLLTRDHGECLPTTPISLFYTILVFGKFSLRYLRLLTTPFNIPTGLGTNSVPCTSYSISFRPLPARPQAAGWGHMASWPYPCSSVPRDSAETPRWVLCTQSVCVTSEKAQTQRPSTFNRLGAHLHKLCLGRGHYFHDPGQQILPTAQAEDTGSIVQFCSPPRTP